MLTNGWAAVVGGARVGGTGYPGCVLVLTRKTNQSIMIGDAIEVSVLAVARDKIRLGITAPRDVPVYRKEVYLSIQEEKVGVEADASTRVDEALEDLSTE
jgi:carbon storage regulator